MRWWVHGSRRVYASEWVNVDLDDVEIPGGARFEHHLIRFPRASVGTIVVDDADRVLLLWRHRFTTDTWGWEIPTGWADTGEDPATAVQREVREETGYRLGHVERWSPTARWPDSARSATSCSSPVMRVRVGEPEAAESDRVEWIAVDELPELAAQNLISDGLSLTALSYYLMVTRHG